MILSDLSQYISIEHIGMAAAVVAIVSALVLIIVYSLRLRAIVKKAAADNAYQPSSSKCNNRPEASAPQGDIQPPSSQANTPEASAPEALEADKRMPSVAVVIYACDNSAQLAEMLPDVLAQDYPSKMEVIVVNDGSSEKIADLVDALRPMHRNLRLTFIPDEAHNLSRKKLAITLGIKGASTDCVVLTQASCRIPSPHWLRRMCRHFAEGKDVVIGNATILNLHGPMRTLDYAAEGATLFSAAIKGLPIRGYGMNLAYRRDLFFANKGFAKSLNLHCGDDDMFVSQITTADNTGVELAADARVSIDDPMPDHAYRDLRLSHLFTARFARRGGRRLMGFCSATMWIWLTATAVAAALLWPKPIALAVLGIAAVAAWGFILAIWNKLGKALGTPVNVLLAMPLLFWRPIRNWRWKQLSRKKDRKNYTWLQ